MKHESTKNGAPRKSKMMWLLFAAPLLVPALWFMSGLFPQSVKRDITISGQSNDSDVLMLSFGELATLLKEYPGAENYEVRWDESVTHTSYPEDEIMAKLVYQRSKRELQQVQGIHNGNQGYGVTWHNVNEWAIIAAAKAEKALIAYRIVHNCL